MTEPVTKAQADEGSTMTEANVLEAPQAEASHPEAAPDAPEKEAAGSDSNADPSESVLVNITEQSSIAMSTEEVVGDEIRVTAEQKKGNTPKKEEGRKEGIVKRGKGSTPGTNAQRRQQRRKKGAGDDGDGDAEPSRTVLKVEEQTSAIVIVNSGDKPGEGGEKEHEQEDGTIDEGMKDGAVRSPTSGTMSMSDKVESSPSKEEGEKEEVPNEGEKTPPSAKDIDGKEKVADKDKVDNAPSKKNKKRKRRNKARAAAAEATKAAEGGAVKKSPATKECSGMIFMCSAETKKECYRYKIFGMPAGKKEMVAKVYKGMRLFLYDIDLKLLYGIYKATSKGGYDIQPKAFKSEFPAQVRFKVFKDYLPLPEEKFKAAIKANYYTKNRFNCELSAEQVEKLCKLFVEASKASKQSDVRATGERVRQNLTSQDPKKRRFQGTVRRRVLDGDRIFPGSLDIYERESYASQPHMQVPFPPRGLAVPRQAVLPPYSSPPRHAPPPLPPPAYVYERPRDVDYYHREVPMEAHGYGVIDSEIRPPFDYVGHNDPYSMHREPAPYHEARYPPTMPSGYHAPAHPAYRY